MQGAKRKRLVPIAPAPLKVPGYHAYIGVRQSFTDSMSVSMNPRVPLPGEEAEQGAGPVSLLQSMPPIPPFLHSTPDAQHRDLSSRLACAPNVENTPSRRGEISEDCAAYFAVPSHATGSSRLITTGSQRLTQPPYGADNFEVEQICSQQLKELRFSHAILSTQMAQLRDEVRCAKKLATEAESVLRGPVSFNHLTLRRALMFANIAATKTLAATSTELIRNPHRVVAANSVRQIQLRSKPWDCTLHDFRLMVTNFSTRENVRSTVVPSLYYALMSSTRGANSFHIEFDSFVDLCDALHIAPDHRQSSFYREKRNAMGDLRCIQVLGVTTEKSAGQSNSRPERKVLLAQSMVRASDESLPSVHVLHQKCARWTNNCWEEGFVYGKESRTQFSGFHMPSTLRNVSSPKARPVRNSSKRRGSSSTEGPSEHAFALFWERNQDCTYPVDLSAEMVPGVLRVVFPAVVLRSRKLVRSTQAIFTSPISEGSNSTLQSTLCSSRTPPSTLPWH